MYAVRENWNICALPTLMTALNILRKCLSSTKHNELHTSADVMDSYTLVLRRKTCLLYQQKRFQIFDLIFYWLGQPCSRTLVDCIHVKSKFVYYMYLCVCVCVQCSYIGWLPFRPSASWRASRTPEYTDTLPHISTNVHHTYSYTQLTFYIHHFEPFFVFACMHVNIASLSRPL